MIYSQTATTESTASGVDNTVEGKTIHLAVNIEAVQNKLAVTERSDLFGIVGWHTSGYNNFWVV